MIRMAAKRKPESSAGSSASFAERLANAQSLQGIFELVKETAWKTLRVDQAGLMLGLAELGISSHGVLGAYYSPEGNTIVMNKTVMTQLKGRASVELYNSYCFYILLHEYLHSCGFYDERENRRIVAGMAAECFGPGHAVTKLATANDWMLRLIQGSIQGSSSNYGAGSMDEGIEFVEGIDRRNTNYIS